MWFYVLNKYSTKNCSETLNLYFYFTSLYKKIPESNLTNTILDEYNVNTAFTRTCPSNSEIVIFRKEEWFKVLIHESFHNFALDFSDIDSEQGNNYILNIFPVNSIEVFRKTILLIKDFCHISPFSQVLVSTVGIGCYLAARTSIVGTQDNPTVVADYCNFIVGSAVTKNITSPGTYFGNRQLNKLTSLDTKID
jgi:hypothetical protein